MAKGQKRPLEGGGIIMLFLVEKFLKNTPVFKHIYSHLFAKLKAKRYDLHEFLI
jgi:hypothetical protein